MVIDIRKQGVVIECIDQGYVTVKY
jgi:hypothetical protein